jgi:hypothetical protein
MRTRPLFATWPLTPLGLVAFGVLAVDGFIRRDWAQGVTAMAAIIPCVRLLIRGL